MVSHTNNSFPRHLILITVSYLFLPNLLFYFFWFKAPYGPALTAGLLAAFFFYVKRLWGNNGFTESVKLSRKEFLIIALAALAWTISAGIGNLVAQELDFGGHNAKLYDLVHSPWPLKYGYNSEEVIYYFSFYLAPASVMKLVNPDSLIPFVIWSAMGYFLVLTWAYILLKKDFRKVILLFILGQATVFINIYVFQALFEYSRNEWPVFFGSLYEQSIWVPNQFLPAFLVMSILIWCSTQKDMDISLAVFPFVLSLTWCVFPAVAIAILFLFFVLFYKSAKTLLSLAAYSLRYLFFVIALILFYQSSNGGGIIEFLAFTSERINKVPLWAGQLFPQLIIFSLYVRFLINDSADKKIAKIILSIMFVVSLCRVGVYNDLVARTFICFYITFLLVFLRNLDFKQLLLHKWIIVLFVIDSFFSIKLIYQKATNNVLYKADQSRVIYRYDDHSSIFDYFSKHASQEEIIQYSSKKDSFYQRYLSRD